MIIKFHPQGKGHRETTVSDNSETTNNEDVDTTPRLATEWEIEEKIMKGIRLRYCMTI